jgi:diguanylate cyclase (GGDEF)-like protein
MKILVADDDPLYCRLLETVLTRWGYQVIIVHDGESFLRVLQEQDPPRLAILNWLMPGMDGIEVCREVRKRKQEPYTYILLLTARSQRRDIVAGLKAEVDDYLIKPFDFGELRERLQAGSRILNLQTELVNEREELRRQATHDALTGLLNRFGVLEILEKEVDRAIREGNAFGLAISDIDNFKQVNDTYGHAIGDAVLCETGNRMRASVRSYDAVGRYGGDEFLIVMPGLDEPAALLAAERLRACIGNDPFKVVGAHIRITMSLGVATSAPGWRGAMDSVIQAADHALYRAKASGRNRVEIASAPDSAEMTAPEPDHAVLP